MPSIDVLRPSGLSVPIPGPRGAFIQRRLTPGTNHDVPQETLDDRTMQLWRTAGWWKPHVPPPPPADLPPSKSAEWAKANGVLTPEAVKGTVELRGEKHVQMSTYLETGTGAMLPPDPAREAQKMARAAVGKPKAGRKAR